MTDVERLEKLEREFINLPCEEFDAELRYLRASDLWCTDSKYMNRCELLLITHVSQCGPRGASFDEADNAGKA